MTEIRFYHLTMRSVAQSLPALLEKALAKHKNIVLRVENNEEAKKLDEALWVYSPSSFLPHAVAGGEYEAAQPVLITPQADNANAATMLVLLPPCQTHDIEGFELVCLMFDGNDETQVKGARSQWKLWKEEGHSLTYWQQDEAGRWEAKA